MGLCESEADVQASSLKPLEGDSNNVIPPQMDLFEMVVLGDAYVAFVSRNIPCSAERAIKRNFIN